MALMVWRESRPSQSYKKTVGRSASTDMGLNVQVDFGIPLGPMMGPTASTVQNDKSFGPSHNVQPQNYSSRANIPMRTTSP
jgi:hypothetical protein